MTRSHQTRGIVALLIGLCIQGSFTDLHLCHALLPAPQDAKSGNSKQLGPVTASFHVSPESPRLSDSVLLTLTLHYEKGVTVDFPDVGEELGEFEVRDENRQLPRVDGSREVMEMIYTLEPLHPGELTIPSLSISFTDSRPEGDQKEHQLTTDPITITVTTMVQNASPTLDDLQPMTGPRELPPEPVAWWKWTGAIGLVLAGALLAWLKLRHRQETVTEPELSPFEIAMKELELLEKSQLAGHDVKEFYVRLTGTVRSFIERTTGVHAPELTTEEFIREIGTGQRFDVETRSRLGEFLESADLVKFAGFRPEAEETSTSLSRARAFVEAHGGEDQQ